MEQLINDLKQQIKEVLNLEELSLEDFDADAPVIPPVSVNLLLCHIKVPDRAIFIFRDLITDRIEAPASTPSMCSKSSCSWRNSMAFVSPTRKKAKPSSRACEQ